jgi:multicomponent K+:H+ antiporter subunit F
MSWLLSSAIVVALGCYAVAMLFALWRLLRGPAAQDRVLAIDFLYVNGMLMTLVLGLRYASSMYFDAGFLIALFGFVSSTAFARFLLRGEVIE